MELRPARAPHPPRAEPDPPGCPPRAGHSFFGRGGAPHQPQKPTRRCIRVTERCHQTAFAGSVLVLRIICNKSLAEMSEDVESRGVDLNLMYRMLISTHYKYTEELFRAFLDGYQETLEDAQESIDRMDTISKRGRYIVRE